jgi:hypothetical protein
MSFSTQITGQQLEKLSARIAQAGRGELQRKMRRNIRQAADPAVRDLRRAVMGVEVASTRGGTAPPDNSTRLRGRIADAIGVQTTTNTVAVRVNGRLVDPTYGSSLVRGMAGQGRWRHPVFGRDVWTQQQGQPWFYQTMQHHEVAFRRAVEQAMAETARELAR